MWTLLIDLLLFVFFAKPRKTPAIAVISLTVVVLGYAFITIIRSSEF